MIKVNWFLWLRWLKPCSRFWPWAVCLFLVAAVNRLRGFTNTNFISRSHRSVLTRVPQLKSGVGRVISLMGALQENPIPCLFRFLPSFFGSDLLPPYSKSAKQTSHITPPYASSILAPLFLSWKYSSLLTTLGARWSPPELDRLFSSCQGPCP